MPDLLKPLLDLFAELPNPLKLVVVLLLMAFVIWLAIRHYLLRSRLRAAKRRLYSVTKERDDLRRRFESLDRVDDHVWKLPDAFGHNHFVDRMQRSTRFIAFCNLKGGVGKTTVALHLGIGLALRAKRVLFIDLDFQGTLSNKLLAPELLGQYRKNEWTTDQLLKPETLTSVVGTHAFPVAEMSGCRVMIAREALEFVEFEQQSRFFVNPDNPEKEVRFRIQRLLHQDKVFRDYDYVFFDCPPRMSTACINALTSADYVVLPTSLDRVDTEAVARTLNWLRELKGIVRADFLGVVISRCRMRLGKVVKSEEGALGQLENMIARHYPGTDYIFASKIPDNPRIGRYASVGNALLEESREVRQCFEPLCQELERRVHR